MEELGLLATMAIGLVVALVGGAAARRLKLPVVVGYLLGGMLIGPNGLALIRDVGDVETLATIGVVLLMFTLGIELSLKSLREVGRVAVIGGAAQIAATAALGLLVGRLLGWSLMEAGLFGAFVAMSSTIVVLKTLMDRGELGSPHGRVMIGILLVQDLCVVPMMVVLPSLGGTGTGLFVALGWAVLKGVVFVAAILVLGFLVLPRFMRRVAEGQSRELFLLAVVSLCLGAAFGAYYVGLSIALGAFLAGLLVSESEYGHQALADIKPLRDVFAALFFVSLGMLASPGFILDSPRVVAAVVAAVVLGKFVIAAIVTRIFGYSAKTSLFVGSGLFQIGEFSFVLAATALATGLISETVYSLTLTTAVITILLTPFGMGLTSGVYHRLIQVRGISKLLARGVDPVVSEEGMPLRNHVVICGYGRTAMNLARVLGRRKFSCVVIDIDPRAIDAAHDNGIPCIYGDAGNPEILAQAGVERAKVLVITFPDPAAARLAVANARRVNPRLDVVARVHRDEDRDVLQRIGVAGVVRPEVEAGLEIIRHTLHRFGLTSQEIEYIISGLREEQT